MQNLTSQEIHLVNGGSSNCIAQAAGMGGVIGAIAGSVYGGVQGLKGAQSLGAGPSVTVISTMLSSAIGQNMGELLGMFVGNQTMKLYLTAKDF